ncbi:MAG: hypothetical protein SVW57_08810, partial [Thermodesulfobacteriota bacterium]|nr:hypothetical protein [Thermodesulfobacteriota bacterium]
MGENLGDYKRSSNDKVYRERKRKDTYSNKQEVRKYLDMTDKRYTSCVSMRYRLGKANILH